MVKTLFIGFLSLVLLAAIAVGGAYLYVTHAYTEPGPLVEEKTVFIAPGKGFKAIARQLEREGVIDSRHVFIAGGMIDKQYRAARAGEYLFAPHMSAQLVMAKLVKGDVVVHAITIPEGLRVAQVLALIAARDGLEGAVPDGVEECTLLPETYHYLRGDSRTRIVAAMATAQQKILARAWENRVEGLPLASPEEALVLASVVEKETGLPEERRMVAGVYINRLNRGMMLQADPTVAYGVWKGKGIDRPITKSDLATDTPYNTYTRTGLPPTPIACPGKASIEAVLNPEVTNALYFVATGTGGHRFASTLDEHNRNVSEYRAILRSQKPR